MLVSELQSSFLLLQIGEPLFDERRIGHYQHFLNENGEQLCQVEGDVLSRWFPQLDIDCPGSSYIIPFSGKHEDRTLVDHDCPLVVDFEMLDGSRLKRCQDIHYRIENTVPGNLRRIVCHTSQWSHVDKYLRLLNTPSGPLEEGNSCSVADYGGTVVGRELVCPRAQLTIEGPLSPRSRYLLICPACTIARLPLNYHGDEYAMTDITQQAQDIREQLPDTADVTPEDIEARLDTLANDYQVPIEEARRSVLNTYSEEMDAEPDDIQTQTESVDLATIDDDEQWVDITAKLVDLWEPRSDAIAQVGLLGDETGTIKFTKWAKSDLPKLHEDRVYRLTNVVTDEYQGQYSVKLNRTTGIEQLDTQMEVGDNAIETEGALVDIQTGSGLIKRCPEQDCTRVLQNGRCSEHGDVEGEFDLRIKGVLDDGDTIQEVLFDRDATETLTGITLEEAQQMAMDALDTEVVGDKMREQTLGQYYRVAGPVMGRYLLVNDFDTLDEPPSHEDVLIRARSM